MNVTASNAIPGHFPGTNAAKAFPHGLTLVSRDARDNEKAHVPVANQGRDKLRE
jgi:hypothetical protein